MNKFKIEIQDHDNNIYHPHTSADVVFLEDKTTVSENILKLKNELGVNKTTLENNINSIKEVL